MLPGGIVGRPHLERHLMIGAEIDGLHVAAAAQVPEVDLMAVAVAEKVFRDDAVLELRRQPPFTRHHVVAGQIPPKIVVELLRAPINLPSPEYLEGFAIHDEHAGRTVGAVRARAPKRADVHALGAAMDRVRPRVPGLAEDLVGLDHLVQLGLCRMWVSVDDVDARRAQAGDDQEPAPEECMTSKR